MIEVNEDQQEGSSLLKKVGYAGLAAATLCAGGTTVLGCVGAVGAAAYSALSDDNTTEMTVADGVKYAPNGVLNCREDATSTAPVVTTFQPGEEVDIVNDRAPRNRDWKFTTENCWVAQKSGGTVNLVVSE